MEPIIAGLIVVAGIFVALLPIIISNERNAKKQREIEIKNAIYHFDPEKRFKIEKEISGKKMIYKLLELKWNGKYYKYKYFTQYEGCTGFSEYDFSIYTPIEFESEDEVKDYINKILSIENTSPVIMSGV